MKWVLAMVGLVVVGVFGWRTGTIVSSDAVAMVVGFTFGALAGVPTALLVMAMMRHTRVRDEGEPVRGGRDVRRLREPYVIVVSDGRRDEYPDNYVPVFDERRALPHNQRADAGGRPRLR